MKWKFFRSWLSRTKMAKAYVAGDLSSAIKYAEESLSCNGEDICSLWTISECYRLQGSYDESIKYAERGFLLDPKHFDTLQLLSELYFEQENYQSAYEYVCKAIAVAEEIDEALGEHIDKIAKTLSSPLIASRPIRAVQRSITGDRRQVKDWIEWAIQFKAWYMASEGSINQRKSRT